VIYFKQKLVWHLGKPYQAEELERKRSEDRFGGLAYRKKERMKD
jgi:hypothetical protein